jgi:hypothetical protein
MLEQEDQDRMMSMHEESEEEKNIRANNLVISKIKSFCNDMLILEISKEKVKTVASQISVIYHVPEDNKVRLLVRSK